MTEQLTDRINSDGGGYGLVKELQIDNGNYMTCADTMRDCQCKRRTFREIGDFEIGY